MVVGGYKVQFQVQGLGGLVWGNTVNAGASNSLYGQFDSVRPLE